MVPCFENWCCFNSGFVRNSAPQKPHWKPSQARHTSLSPVGVNILPKNNFGQVLRTDQLICSTQLTFCKD